MSVINQMLQDLEQRKVNSEVSNHYIDEVNIIAQKKNYLWPFLVVLAGTVLIGILYYFFLFNDSSPKQTQLINLTLPEPKISDYNEIMVVENLSSIKPVKQVETIVPAVVKIEKKTDQEKQDTPSQYKKTPINVKKNLPVNIKPQPKPQPKPKPKPLKKSDSEVKKHYVNAAPVFNNTAMVISQAQQLMQKDVTKSIALLEENLARVIPNSDYYALLANLYLREQRFNEANSFYQKALKKDQKNGNLWIGLALSFQGLGNNDNARKAFKQASVSSKISPKLQQYAKQQSMK